MKKWICAAFGLALLPSLSQADGLFIGEVAGTDALVALAVAGDQVQGYLCDGTDEALTVWARFDGVLGATTDLVAANGTALSFAGPDPLSGTIVLQDGTSTSFTTALAEGDAGWWTAQGVVDGEDIGFDWIRAADGRVVGTGQKGRPPRVTSVGASNGPASGISDGTSNVTAGTLTQALDNANVLDIGAAHLDVVSMAVD